METKILIDEEVKKERQNVVMTTVPKLNSLWA